MAFELRSSRDVEEFFSVGMPISKWIERTFEKHWNSAIMEADPVRKMFIGTKEMVTSREHPGKTVNNEENIVKK